ncbi:hypothetical protein AMK33_10915 [Streptomyces sp. CB02400]|nr:hypothetical protein AMK33_10915 [Streptomyces sp. CB02400]
MSTAYVPPQPHRTNAPAPPPPEPPPVPPHASEATRLLCAGTYQDSEYRDRVIEELHLDEQRVVAPSSGFDAARFLAHALRARRQELLWSTAVIGLWAVGVPLSGGICTFAAYGADADGRDDERELLRTALGHFCPPDAPCGTDTQ